MNIIETLNEGLLREYSVKVEASEIAKYYQDEIQKLTKDLKIPGFRPGKVPESVVKQHYHDKINATVLQNVIEKNTVDLFKEKNINPVEQPKIEIESFEDNKGLTYKISVETFPEITIPDTSGIKLEKIISDVEDQNIDKSISEIAGNNKEYTKIVKGAAKEGMAVLIDYKGQIDSIEFDGGKAENHTLVLGSKTFIPGFEDQLIGCKKGEEKIVKVMFPQEYHAKDLAGKEAEFTVNVKDVFQASEPEINDEFAKKFGLKDLAELKEFVKSKLLKDVEEVSKTNLKKHLFDALELKCDFPLPNSLVDKEFNIIWNNYKKSPEGTTTDKSEDVTKAEFKKLAERRVKLGMLIAEIGKIDQVTITQNDIRDAIMKQATHFAGQEHIVMDYYRKNPNALESLKGPILEDKVVDNILTKIKTTEKNIPLDELFEKVKKGEL